MKSCITRKILQTGNDSWVDTDYMNVFILNSGRCGSTTFIEACNHISNYSAAHESRIGSPGPERLKYPDDHIEADNRLSWFLGRLDQAYGDSAYYVHLKRDAEETARSFMKRSGFGIMRAYREGIYLLDMDHDATTLAHDYLDTIDANITHFLKDKTRTMEFMLEDAKTCFRRFWEEINAAGDLDAALGEWDTRHNHS